MHWNLGRIYLHLKSNTKLTTLPTLCDTEKLVCTCQHGLKCFSICAVPESVQYQGVFCTKPVV